MAILLVSFLIGFILSSAVASVHFSISDCNHSPNKIIQISHVHLSADPLRIPGPETFSGDLEILRNISGNHIRLDVVIEKHILFGWPDMPCITASGQQVGSCSYNLCDLLSRFKDGNGTSHCPLQLEQDHFPCACPFAPGHYRLNHATFQVPEVQALYKFLAGGDYKVHVKFVDTNTNEQVGCYDIMGTVVSSCSGFLCSIIG